MTCSLTTYFFTEKNEGSITYTNGEKDSIVVSFLSQAGMLQETINIDHGANSTDLHTKLKKSENTALFPWLAIPFALTRNEDRAFQKRSLFKPEQLENTGFTC